MNEELIPNVANLDQPGPTPTLDDMGVKMDEILQEYRLSASYVYLYTRDFQSLDNLVDAIPVLREDDAPFVGDTTMAGLVRSIPRASLKQLPVLSVVVNGTKISIDALLCSYLLRHTAFNEDTFGKGLLSTLQIAAEQAITHGYAPVMIATGTMYNDYGTTMRLIHFSDTSPEPGISDANESAYHYVVAHLTPSRVRKILKQAKRNAANGLTTTWNIPALEQVLETAPQATTYSIYESDAKRNQAGENAGPTYQFITRYETGPQPTTVTFCPDLATAPLRVMESKSKWGYPRVQYLVIDPAALTPFGVSRVRLASPNQNLMNIYYGNIASMLLLNSKPPIFKRGRFTKPVDLKQGVVWEALDPNAEARLMTMDNGALSQFVPMAQQFAGQIQNIMGGQTMTVNSGSKASGFSKTAPGVRQAQDFMDINTNQITKILENFLRQYGLSALDVLFSEQEGIDWVIVDDETKNSMNEVQPGFVGDDNKVQVDWAGLYARIEEWSVEIDVSLSPDELEDKKRADLQDMLVVLAQNAQELGPGAVDTVNQLTNMLLKDKAPLARGITQTQVPVQPTPAQTENPYQPNAGELTGQ